MQGAFCEHIVKQKAQGKFLIFKILAIAFYIALAVIPSGIIIAFAPANLTVPFLIVIAAVVFITFKLTWKYTCLEYEYQIIDDTISFTKIYGKTRRKTVIEMPMRAFTTLGAHTPESEKYLGELLVNRTYLYISSFNAENIYFGVFNANDEVCIVFFEATDTAISKLKKYGSSAMRTLEREIKRIEGKI